MPTAPAKRPRQSAAHRQAISRGREEARTVRAYLEAIESTRPTPGRRRTAATITSRIEAITKKMPDADVLSRVQMAQEQLDLQAELDQLAPTVDLPTLEKDFIKVARSYSQRKQLTYDAWRSVGVPAAVLRAAKITRAG